VKNSEGDPTCIRR